MCPIRKAALFHFLWLLAATALSGCGVGQRPVVQAQMCVENPQGISKLREILRKASSDAGLKFIDYSAERPAQLKATGASLDFLRSPKDYFEVWGDGGSGSGFAASNLGLSSFEVSIGFNGGGEDQAETKLLAQRVISELSKHWPVAIVPPGRGALPTGQCPSSKPKK